MSQKIGANYLGDNRCEFIVWAPLLNKVAVEIVAPEKQLLPMQQDDKGYWHTTASNVAPETLYFYQLEGQKTRPDPASHFQSQGVHEASQVVDHSAFTWDEKDWKSIPAEEYIVYELHVGTFTQEGTFTAIIPRLPELIELGINAIEIMPIAQFPGERNWGYDGVYPFAVQNSYGGPEQLKELVNACHQQGVAVILDVVYNHFGPEGNYVGDFAPYFTTKYKTAWGNGINYDDAYSYGVRNLVIENALYWLREYHIDSLRLDAADNIVDYGAKHILAELAENVAAFSQQQGRQYYLFAESDLNDAKLIRPQTLGGYGLNVHWCDDFHHCVHTLLTQEKGGYYEDFGLCEHLAKTYRESFVYTWNYSTYRLRNHGNSASDRPPYQFLVFSQNHDQVGNRMLGERLSNLVSFEALKLAAGTVLLSPYIPLLFMGEEYGEESPFIYFIDHSDPDLIKAVREGRRTDFKAFHLKGEPPDSISPETFQKCKLKWEQRTQGKHKVLLEFYRKLIQLRRQIPALRQRQERNVETSYLENDKIFVFRRCHQENQIICLMNFNQEEVHYIPVVPDGNWKKCLDSSELEWLGPGSKLTDLKQDQSLILQPQSFILYKSES